MANEKARHWTFIVYPESAPENWKTILQETGCEIAISPLHDKDINDEESKELKKEHWHVIISYANTTTYNNVKNLTDSINSPIPKKLNSIKGMYRYFTHMDNPDKAQYDAREIMHLNGFDENTVTQLTVTQKYIIKQEIIGYIKEFDVRYYSDLLEYLMLKDFDWFKVALDNTLLFTCVIKSFNDKRRRERFNND